MAVDESMLTGESLPVYKGTGELLYGGTLVTEGSICMLVTTTGDDSTLGRIVSTVQEAQASKPPIQEIADLIARLFVPVVSFIALLTFLVWLFIGTLGNLPVKLLQEGNFYRARKVRTLILHQRPLQYRISSRMFRG